MIYRIANLTLDIRNFYFTDETWEKFQLSSTKNCPIDLEVDVVENNQRGFYLNLEIFDGFQTSDQIVRMDGDIMLVRDNWKYGKIFPIKNSENAKTLIMQLFYSQAIKSKKVQFHSALINTDKKGILFLGPSGIGKTTQAELWSRYRKALIVNGDMVFVQETDDEFLGWGTPWHGSSPYCENTSVPLNAMIVLKQAPENSIRELTGFEKVTEVSNSVFYPQWLENGMELCLETLDHLLTRIPVYELSCRPDEDAVRLAEEAVFGSCG